MKKMGKKKRTQLMLIGGMAAILLIIIAVIVLLIVKSNKKLESISLTPTFAETELDVNSDYTFMITTEPEGAKLKKMEYVVDDETALFEASNSSNESAVLHTGSEGTLTVYVKVGDVKSNFLSFSVVDLKAKAEEEAKAQAQAQAEAEQAALEAQLAEEEAANKKNYIKAIDTPRVRTSPNTDSTDNVIGKLTVGDVYEVLDEADGWVHITFKDQDAYVSSDYVQSITEEEYQEAISNGGNAGETSDETAKKTETNTTTNNNNNNTTQTTDNTQAQQSTTNSETAAAQAAANAQAIADAQAAAQAAAAQAAAAQAAAAGTTINCKDGACLVTASQLQTIHATWDFAGDAVEMAGHHSISELEAVIGPVTRM